MKINFICFKFPKAIFFIICFILIILAFLGVQIKNFKKEKKELPTSVNLVEEYNKVKNNTIIENTYYSSSKQIEIHTEKKLE